MEPTSRTVSDPSTAARRSASANGADPDAEKKLTFTDWRFCRQNTRMMIKASVPTTIPIHVRLVRVARATGRSCEPA